MANPTWIGSNALAETPESPDYEETDNGTSITQTFEGSYSACMSDKPKVGDTMKNAPADVYVEKIKITKMPGGKGKLQISGNSKSIKSSDGGDENKTVYEIEWAEIQKPLITHPLFQSFNTNSAILCTLEAWENTPYKYKVEFKFDTGEGDDADSRYLLVDSKAREYQEKRLKGIESYTVYVPVARKTMWKSVLPQTGTCGNRASRPFSGCPTTGPNGKTYIWIKTADRASRESMKRWQHTQEWSGFEEVDTDLYP